MNVPGEGRVIIDTVGMGELLGCSWLARRLQSTRTRLIAESVARGAGSAAAGA